MKTVEIYIVKSDNFESYEIKNTIGVGLNKTDRPTPYKVDTSVGQDTGFTVYVNDIELTNLVDYVIGQDGYTLHFMEPLEIGDIIKIEDSIPDTAKIVTKNSYNKNALFKILSEATKLKYNHDYVFELPVQNKIFSTKFTSTYDPFYSTIKKIRNDTGNILDGVKDSIIANLIYLHSKEVNDVLTDGAGGTPDEVTVAATNVVRYRTDLDLINAIYLNISGRYGKIDKKIGNIEVAKEIKLPLLEEMLSRFKELLKPNEDALYSTNNIATFVKANSTSYTVESRGVF